MKRRRADIEAVKRVRMIVDIRANQGYWTLVQWCSGTKTAPIRSRLESERGLASRPGTGGGRRIENVRTKTAPISSYFAED